MEHRKKPVQQTDNHGSVYREDREDGQGREDREEVLQEQEDREEPLNWWDCDECSFQAEEEIMLERHIKQAHRITCYTCKDTFKSFSEMIEHRRAKHPSTKKCYNFPKCVNEDRCLYIHEGSVENNKDGGPHGGQTQREEGKIVCRTCQVDFKNKNKMMVHRKREHLNIVGVCKNILAGINCRNGPENCWYRHDQCTIPKSTIINNTKSVPAFTPENFPFGPTPRKAVVGPNNVEFQLIQQTLQQQQQQMATMMAAILQLAKNKPYK